MPHLSGSRVRESRAKTGKTQAQMAACIGISRQSYVAIEAGHQPSLPTALTLARVLSTTVEALFADHNGEAIANDNSKIVELSQRILFNGSHRLDRPGQPDAAGSRQWHGHDYQVRIVLRAMPDPITGMVCDLGDIKRAFEPLRAELTHTNMDDVSDLGSATVENLAQWIFRKLLTVLPDLHRIEVSRDAHGDVAIFPVY